MPAMARSFWAAQLLRRTCLPGQAWAPRAPRAPVLPSSPRRAPAHGPRATTPFSTTAVRARQAGQNYDYYPQQPVSPAPPAENAPYSPPQPPPPRRRRLPWGRMLTITIFLGLGWTTATAIREQLFPSAFPVPGSPDDAFITREIHKMAAKEPLIRQLETDPEWEEIEADLSSSLPGPEARERHLIAGALRGARGMEGYSRVWRNREGLFVSVIYFGPATAGWPGVVHGGLLSGVLGDECGWRPTVAHWGPNGSWMNHVETSFRRPVRINRFMLITAHKVPEEMAPEVDYDKYLAVASAIWELREVKDLKKPGCQPLAVVSSVWSLIEKQSG
ncbi:hypothetical protein GQ53DRAFT_338135 [Thozetella sp. PMI_491]|nr:hypothetical protein GQ53DRAFT_338135 [Thozetella sp. PMI_491]